MTVIKEIEITRCKSCEKMIPKDTMYCPYCEGINNKRGTVLNKIEGFKYIIAGFILAAFTLLIIKSF